MKVEQAGEKLHASLNNIERRLEKIKKTRHKDIGAFCRNMKILSCVIFLVLLHKEEADTSQEKTKAMQKKYNFHGRKIKL